VSLAGSATRKLCKVLTLGNRVKIKKPEKALLDWSTLQRMFPWNVVFLVAGGFALANGAVVSTTYYSFNIVCVMLFLTLFS